MTATIISVLGILIMGALGLWIKNYLSSYMNEKGKNLATKEDVGVLTHEVESVKLQYQRASVVSQAQFSAEFATYGEIWECLIDVQRSALALRSMIDYGLREGETKEQRQQERLRSFGETFNKFTRTYWKRRPFYPDEVFKELEALARLAHVEAIGYEHRESRGDRDYWKEAWDNAQKISDQVERICSAIRDRLARLSAV